MGVGKTTVGLELAKKLNRDFVDADQAIEERYRMPVREIFSQFGEAKFREMERDFITGLCVNTSKKIVSLGGGAFMQEEIREACLATSNVFFLDISWELWKNRYHLLMENRPLLQSKSLEEVEELFNLRKSTYSINHAAVLTDELNPEQVADRILETLEQWQAKDR
ncbi:shikimate kinase [Cohnella sp. AR92]|uniref:shikimate kinase n=1 Tax=Cohnella sp. AR92 TaxID=648716 RepID=UPI000F8D7AC5|nr:shikimate kinase [Cohnella sp. AR92]